MREDLRWSQAELAERAELGLPALNEEATVGRVIAVLKAALMDAVPLLDEIVVIDSKSTDATRKIAADMGAKVFSTKEVEKPRFFHEHFTNTDSWILRSETIRLTSPGRYYLVAFSPQGQSGKLWLSIGKKESFSLDDFKQFPTWAKRIQEFHEVKK